MRSTTAGSHQLRWEAISRYRNGLVAYARRTGAGADAEDVAQEALVNAYLSPFLDEARPAPYLKKVADRLARSRHRRCADTIAVGLVRAAPTGPPAEDRAVLCDLARRAVRRLGMTETPTTVTMVLRRVNGATWPEIAAESGVTAEAAESRVCYALFLLRHWLDRRLR